MLKDIIVSAVLPYATYLVLTGYGVGTVHALIAGAIFPVVSVLWAFLRERRIQALGLIVLAATVASALGALAVDSPTLALAKGSMITASVGLIFGASLFARRPLVFHLAAGSDAQSRAETEQRWGTSPRYRATLRTITIAWTIGLFIEAALRLALIPLLPIAIFLPTSETMWIVFFALMTAWSWRYGRMRMGRDPTAGPPTDRAAEG
ncbi:VC0807 family protein [Consotaella aegiceratis]|uniref:VC0807 family protein n=1 Tax=Consotaella aegiceratis TaxID=3097961 RepID=UPI002F411500